MKSRKIKMLLGIALLLLSAGIWMGCSETTGITQPVQQNEPFTTNGNDWNEKICKGDPVPHGQVIVSQAKLSRCPGTGKNAWEIRYPNFNTDEVCKASPIPSRYEIYGTTSLIGCPGGLNNGWMIRYR